VNLESLGARRLLSSLLGVSKRRTLEHPFAAQRRFFEEQPGIVIFDIGAYVGDVASVLRSSYSR
jgi:hypothetical protein